MSVMELGHLLTRSGLTYLEVSSEVCHDSFCQLRRLLLFVHAHTHTHTHTISECVDIIYELQLLPKNTSSNTSGALRSVDWIFITGAPAWRLLGEHVTLDKML